MVDFTAKCFCASRLIVRFSFPQISAVSFVASCQRCPVCFDDDEKSIMRQSRLFISFLRLAD
jgi:hypothetical protein